MADLQDADGDSQMDAPSSPSTDSENAMFPSANIDPDPEHPHDLQASVGDPSSPPASQGPARQNGTSEETMDAGGAEETLKAAGFGSTGEDIFVPGSSWNNKKAREEWHRAWNLLEDKNFTLKEFGDPFDEILEGSDGNKS